MKLWTLLLVVLSLASSAWAGNVTLSFDRGRDEGRLPSCEGTVELTKSAQGNGGGEQVNLVFRGVRFCSNFDIVSNDGYAFNYDDKKIPGPDGNRGGSFTLPKKIVEYGWNKVKIVVRSNKGTADGQGHYDTVTVKFTAVPVPAPRPAPVPRPAPRDERHNSMRLTIGDEAYLTACGGQVAITKSAQGNSGSEQLNLVFRGVARCQLFDIIKNNGDKLDYSAKEIQGYDGNRGGSFTLPKRVLEYGWNNVKVLVRSVDGYITDTITVEVKVVPVPTPRPTPPRDDSRHRSMTLYLGEEAYLDACGGMVSITKSAQGNGGGEQVNLVFRGIERCEMFDILKTNGETLDYSAKPIQMQGGARGGSFTLPKRVLELGWNSVKVIVRSGNGRTSDTINVQVRVVELPPTNPPAPPSGGGGNW